jgi:TRAP transporter TAXI family solute receptor
MGLPVAPLKSATELDDFEGAAAPTPVRWRLWIVAALTVIVLIAAVYFFGPSPPRRIVMAAGQGDGVYTSVARSYQARLSKVGLEVRVVETNGSVDNLQRLLRGEVDVALVQAGTSALVHDADERLRGLAALYFEPLWIFHRDPGVTSVAALQGRRVSIGPTSSGTEAVGKAFLREYGVEDGPLVANLTNAEARQRLVGGQLDAAFFVTSYRDPAVLDLLGRQDIHLMGFRRDAAHARKFSALQPLKVPEGVIDLRRNIPAQDKTLLAAAALLVSREDLHPRVVEQLLKVANALHRPGSLLDPPLRFPSLDGLDLLPHEAAEVYLTQGESWLSRMLPYPILRWVLILRVLVLPILIVWLPLLRVLPEVSNWKVDRHFARLYAMLQRTEHAVAHAQGPEEIHTQIGRLDWLATSTVVLCRKVPPTRRRDVYHWRLHIALVRQDANTRLAQLEALEPVKT